ncbi:calbindin-like [Carassius auratus]|uniref:Calbindin n=1 Tax=Carassius auratus TaxID=7957 RepID=A0A6P6LGQ7_CARAU|nr:calbindin-like [Carassius auratus]
MDRKQDTFSVQMGEEGGNRGNPKRRSRRVENIHKNVSRWMLPEELRETYLERANCCPPPIFIILVSLAESQLVQILPTEENFLLFFRQQLKSCAEFMEAWRNYDADHSGYIEADELKNFLKDLLQRAKKPYDEKKLEEYTLTTLKIFDSNKDGKLCLSEMARLLPDQENFLLKFQGVKMARKEFNKIFEVLSQDRNGYMDENELDALLKDLCEKNNKVLEVSKIPTYKSAIMALSDGGKLYRTELALVLCAEEM